MRGSGTGRGDIPEAPVAGARLEALDEADLDQVESIERSCFSSPWTREHFLFELHRNRFAQARVVRQAGRVLAYAWVWHLFDELKINNLAVHPEFRQRGLAAWLLRRLMEEGAQRGCRIACLEVRPSNATARALYARLGFAQIGVRRNYYEREGEDALLLEAPLVESEGPRGAS